MLFESAFIDIQVSLKTSRLHIILLKMFGIPRSWQLFSFDVFKVVRFLWITSDDSEKSFPNRP
jgi:hypothetical protein